MRTDEDDEDDNKRIRLEDIENYDIESSILILGTPTEWGEETVTELHIRRPSGGEMRAVRKKKDGDIILLSRVTGRPVLFLEKLDCYDYTNLNKVVAGFTENSPKTGRSGSES